MRIANVQLHERAYPVFIGTNARAQLKGVIEKLPGVDRLALIVDTRVAELHLETLLAALQDDPLIVRVPEGERSKSLDEAKRIYGELAQARLGRKDLVLTFGGGVVGDLGGFVAATWMRGVRLVQVPTTLESAIDASVGGKTAVDHPAGKNLIGAFHQPSAVVIDTDFLATLPERDFLAGLGESVKHAAIRDAKFLAWHEDRAEAITARDADVVEALITRNCEIKAEVVARDEREENLRMILNHGHTIGHAIEHLLGYELRHGECVALGMLVENEIARARGMLTDATATRVRALIERLGMMIRLPRDVDVERVAEVCQIDKKTRGGAVQFVLITELASPKRVADVTTDEIRSAMGVVAPQ